MKNSAKIWCHMRIGFNTPPVTGLEAEYISEVIALRQFAGGGVFSQRCEAWLEQQLEAGKALLTTSCTSALEMAAMLIVQDAGDEIIMPSFTFVSTANAFALHGGKPVFVDIRPDTLNIDEQLIEAAITPRTRAIVVVHYASVACDMAPIMAIAAKHGVAVIEDNAHGVLARYGDRLLGSMGHLAALSFHETKNLTCGQGGALLVNDASLLERAYVLRDKGTNRKAFERRTTAFYSWVDKGSNYTLSEIQAAFLWAQMEQAQTLIGARMACWRRYQMGLASLQEKGVKLPYVPEYATHNAHIFYLVLPKPEHRDSLLSTLATRSIDAPFHYIPLHRSAGYEHMFGRTEALPVTELTSACLLRLPMCPPDPDMQDEVIEAVLEWAAHAL